MRTRSFLLICLLALLPRAVFAQLKAVPYASGFASPVAFVQDPSDAANQFVVQQDGRIRLVRTGVVQSTDFLDIGTQIASVGEQGLLGMAVSPDYATSGRFFLYFTAPAGSAAGAAEARRDVRLRVAASWMAARMRR